MSLSVEQIRATVTERVPPSLVVSEHTENSHYYRHTGIDEKYPSVTTKTSIIDSPHLKMWSAREAIRHIEKRWDHITEENKKGIFDEAIMAHRDTFEDAGDVGTKGHDIIEHYLLDWIRTGERPDDIRSYIKTDDSRLYAITRSAEKFMYDFEVLPIASEMRVASTKHKYAGTLDALMMVGKITKETKGACEPGYHSWFVTSASRRRYECVKCESRMRRDFALVDWKTSNQVDKLEYALQVSAYYQALYEMSGLRPKEQIIVQLDKYKQKYNAMTLQNRAEAFRAFLNCSKLYDYISSEGSKVIRFTPKETIKLEDLTIL